MLLESRILVVEDNPAQAGAIRFCLERCGLPCTVIANGYEAWKLLQVEDFALLLTDHQMPGLSGCQLVERIRQDLRLASLPIIMLTAKRLELDVSRLKEEFRVNAVMMKPFSPRELIRLVDQL
jgi:CheY-like chemotaxis protein